MVYYVYYTDYMILPFGAESQTPRAARTPFRTAFEAGAIIICLHSSEVGKRGWINGVPAKCPQIRHKMYSPFGKRQILQKEVQWKPGVVICMVYTSLLYDTAPIHCTPLRLHPPLMNTRFVLVLV